MSKKEFLKLIFKPQIFLEVILVIMIPFINMGLNSIVEKIAEIFHNYTLPNFFIILFQMLLSLIIITAIYIIEKKKSFKGLSQMFIISIALTFILYFFRLVSFVSRGIIGIIFSKITSFSMIGVEPVFVVSIPVVKLLGVFEPYIGVLFIVFLRSIANIVFVLPLMRFSLSKLGIFGIFITLYISQFIIIFLFAKFPYFLSKYSFIESLRRSIFSKDKHFSFILTFSSIYAFIVAISVLSLPIFSSRYIFPAIINFIEVFSLLAFFVLISKEELYE